VDFYTGTAYQAMGFDPSMFTVLFAIPRMAGWLAHLIEFRRDPERRISRPRQIYVGEAARAFKAMDAR
jgi:citrate synthase